MSIRWAAVLGAHAVVMSLCAGARADAVPTPLDDCPRGATGDSSHSGTWCRPTTCQTDLDCEKNATFWDRDIKKICRDAPLCVEERTEPRLSLDGKPILRSIAHGECGAGASCQAPAVCRAEKRCVVPPPPPKALIPGCSCGIADAASSAAPPALALFLIAGAVASMRRRTPRSAPHMPK